MTGEHVEVFLTGATGFLGHYLLAELLNHPRVRCRVLLSAPIFKSSDRLAELLEQIGLDLMALIAEGRVVPIEGRLPNDVHQPDLDGVDLILHAAGNTTFRSSGSGEPGRTNVEGTRALLSLARGASVPRFVFVSTAYVCGDRTGHQEESFLATRPSFRNDYECSKWQAEALVWNWGCDTGIATICRPSILFGDRKRGRATAMKGLYVVAKATDILARAMDEGDETNRHQIPLRILGRGDATCNVVPVDWVAQKVCETALQRADESSVHHITNPDPPTHEEVKTWLEAHFDIGGGRFSDATWPLADANHYEDLFYSLGNICLDYFRNGLTFESRCAESIPPEHRLIDRASFLRCLNYAQESNWCRAAKVPLNLRPPAGGIDPAWYFECFLPAAVPRSTVAKVEELTAIVQYTITGSVGGSWVSRFERGLLMETLVAPCALEATFEYRLSYDDLVDVVSCRKPLQEVFFHGSAEMFGDVERALKMVPIIGEFLREFPVAGGERSTTSPAGVAC